MDKDKFRAVFMAHVPDADPDGNVSVTSTKKYELKAVFIKNIEQAVDLAKTMASEGADSFLLCPGFTHRDVAMIVDAVGEHVSVNICRGDPPSDIAAHKKMSEVGWFSEKS